jgi:hypothetical protein
MQDDTANRIAGVELAYQPTAKDFSFVVVATLPAAAVDVPTASLYLARDGTRSTCLTQVLSSPLHDRAPPLAS